MRSAFLVLSFVASALAYSVTTPNQSVGWTNVGDQPLVWTRVNTDPTNFTALLTNQDRSLLPTPEVLVALVDGTKGSISVSPPSNGWPPGSGFQVNLVKDPNDLNTIYAQSAQFNITAGSSSASSTSTGVTTLSRTTMTAVTTPTVTDTSTGTSSALNPTATHNAALPAVGANPMFVGAIALLGAFFA